MKVSKDSVYNVVIGKLLQKLNMHGDNEDVNLHSALGLCVI